MDCRDIKLCHIIHLGELCFYRQIFFIWIFLQVCICVHNEKTIFWQHQMLGKKNVCLQWTKIVLSAVSIVTYQTYSLLSGPLKWLYSTATRLWWIYYQPRHFVFLTKLLYMPFKLLCIYLPIILYTIFGQW